MNSNPRAFSLRRTKFVIGQNSVDCDDDVDDDDDGHDNGMALGDAINVRDMSTPPIVVYPTSATSEGQHTSSSSIVNTPVIQVTPNLLSSIPIKRPSAALFSVLELKTAFRKSPPSQESLELEVAEGLSPETN